MHNSHTLTLSLYLLQPLDMRVKRLHIQLLQHPASRLRITQQCPPPGTTTKSGVRHSVPPAGIITGYFLHCLLTRNMQDSLHLIWLAMLAQMPSLGNTPKDHHSIVHTRSLHHARPTTNATARKNPCTNRRSMTCDSTATGGKLLLLRGWRSGDVSLV